MAVVFRDGFDSYGSTADMLRKWSAIGGWTYTSTGGRTGGGGITATGAQQILYTPTGLTSAAEWCAGFWYKVSTTPSALCAFITPLNSALGVSNCIAINTSGQMAIYATALGVNLRLGPGSRNICDNQWHWIEIDMNTGNGTTNKIYIDSTQELSGATPGAASIAADKLQILNPTTTTCTLDDIMVWDNTAGNGPIFSSLPLGPRQITTARPDGDGVITFVPSTGSSNYSLIDEQTFDSADYVESGTSGDQDLYDYAAIATNLTGINDVGVISVLFNPNPGTINFQSALKSGGTTTLGTSTITPSTYTTKQASYGIDPATGSAWANAAAVNAMQAGIKVV